ncbi:hypothetical protein FRC04_002263 [Tulasnella sp. 424]|nr:hypothetical protein FRC04_002263 [Tulasnella sp. 424]KAG8977337.1 hypothetical protein FRC05_001735 [Tulasnella sp. 425]
MQPVHETHDYLSSLPLELFISILTLSLDSENPRNALICLEQLRLVSKTWLRTIDSTPQFWTTIFNDPETPARMKEWIKKSGGAPLRIISMIPILPVEPFMAPLYPVAHRWKYVSIAGLGWNASPFFDKPAPLLEELLLLGVSFEPDTILLADITPSLVAVELVYVTVPRDLGFLKCLKTLQFERVTHPSGKVRIGQLYEILSASPSLRRLSLDTNYDDDTCRRDPLPFPDLADLTVRSRSEDVSTSAILSMIKAPNLFKLSTEVDHVPPTLVLGLSISWLRRQSSDQPEQYDIKITAERLIVSVVPKENGSGSSESALLSIGWNQPTFKDGIIEILEELERLITPHVAVTMEVDSMPHVVDYLETSKMDKDGTQSWPLHNLRSIHFKISGLTSSLRSVSDFAETRGDIARITAQLISSYGRASKWYRWDWASMSFIRLKGSAVGLGVGNDD